MSWLTTLHPPFRCCQTRWAAHSTVLSDKQNRVHKLRYYDEQVFFEIAMVPHRNMLHRMIDLYPTSTILHAGSIHLLLSNWISWTDVLIKWWIVSDVHYVCVCVCVHNHAFAWFRVETCMRCTCITCNAHAAVVWYSDGNFTDSRSCTCSCTNILNILHAIHSLQMTRGWRQKLILPTSTKLFAGPVRLLRKRVLTPP